MIFHLVVTNPPPRHIWALVSLDVVAPLATDAGAAGDMVASVDMGGKKLAGYLKKFCIGI